MPNFNPTYQFCVIWDSGLFDETIFFIKFRLKNLVSILIEYQLIIRW